MNMRGMWLQWAAGAGESVSGGVGTQFSQFRILLTSQINNLTCHTNYCMDHTTNLSKLPIYAASASFGFFAASASASTSAAAAFAI